MIKFFFARARAVVNRVTSLCGISVCCALFLSQAAMAQQDPTLADGLYPVISPGDNYRLDTLVDVGFFHLETLPFSSLFSENQDSIRWVTIRVDDYVPLILSKAPESERQTEEKLNLMLALTEEASDLLRQFSERYLNQRVAIVVDNEVVSMHGIREPITSGLLQISWCGENACRVLQAKLQGNVRPVE